MRTQIFVEGFELDLTNDIACEISYVIDDVKDFGSKNTSYSKTIVIQGTQKNNKIFNHISELGRFIAIENVNKTLIHQLELNTEQRSRTVQLKYGYLFDKEVEILYYGDEPIKLTTI